MKLTSIFYKFTRILPYLQKSLKLKFEVNHSEKKLYKPWDGGGGGGGGGGRAKDKFSLFWLFWPSAILHSNPLSTF